MGLFKKYQNDELVDAIMGTLFTETNSTIPEIWKSNDLNPKLPTFYNLLKLPHYLHYPREVAASLQAFDPATRRNTISEILQKYENKKVEVDDLEAAQVIFLMQGLASPAAGDDQAPRCSMAA